MGSGKLMELQEVWRRWTKRDSCSGKRNNEISGILAPNLHGSNSHRGKFYHEEFLREQLRTSFCQRIDERYP